ncbi:DUF6079 family protein [Thauera sp. SWB20]|uniref:DUF6079 family protein n=1 Tax=Thauera sp. SWB20 TaxID=1572758 RepID=UPI0005ADCF97|nr:DUF6079 family protein [Thauera sp. SWB20]KIN88319.1 hypothetical protein PO78_250 [Thauera sp. SWB20]
MRYGDLIQFEPIESVIQLLDANRPDEIGRPWKFKLSEADEWVRSGGARDDSSDNKNDRV